MSYVKFTSNDTFRISAAISFGLSYTKAFDGAIQYSDNSSSWYDWNGAEILINNLDQSTQKYTIYFRGSSNTRLVYTTNFLGNTPMIRARWLFDGHAPIDCEGSIESLFEYTAVDNNQHITNMADYACFNLFKGSLIRTPPTLSATTLSTGCYRGMFEDCVFISELPELPATTIPSEAYQDMFKNSGIKISITGSGAQFSIPSTAITSGDTSYSTMFEGCGIDSISTDTTYIIQPTQLYSTIYSELNSVANAIRNKYDNLSSTLTFPQDFSYYIENIETGITPTGTISITSNGTTDVTNYASASVSVTGSTFRSGSNYPSDSLGSNNDFYTIT